MIEIFLLPVFAFGLPPAVAPALADVDAAVVGFAFKLAFPFQIKIQFLFFVCLGKSALFTTGSFGIVVVIVQSASPRLDVGGEHCQHCPHLTQGSQGSSLSYGNGK